MSKKDERIPQIVDMMLRPGGATINEICDRLDISRKLVRDYLNDLQNENVPVQEKPDYHGKTNSKRWFINTDDYARAFSIKLSATERLMLRSVLERTRMFEKTELKDTMATLKSKVNAVTLHDPRKRVTTTYASFKGGKDYCGKEYIIDTVLKAIELSLPCTVTYRAANSGEAKTYEIEPYTFVDHGNALYCIAAIPAHNRDIRVLAIERIEKITHHADRSFAIKDGYDPEEYLGASFGIIVEDPVRVRVHFTASAAFYARERVWGQEQTVEEEADGGIILSFTAAGLTEIKRWALSFGSAARVIEPENLAASVAAEAEALAATYRNNG